MLLRNSLHRGFTLIEAIFSIFLIFLVLSALAYTLQQAGTVKSNFRNMGELTEVVQAISLIKSDVRACLDLEVPAGGLSDEIKLRRIDPFLPLESRIDLTSDFDAFETDEEAEVTYFVETGVLKRRFKRALGTPSTERMLAVEGFQAERESSPDILTVTLSVKNTRRTQEHTVKVSLK